MLVEDDRPSLTALCAVTIYCVAFPEGLQGQHNAQSPSKGGTRQPGTAGNWAQPGTGHSCTRLSTSSLEPLFLLGTPTEVFPPVQRTGLLAAPNPS